MITVLGQIAAYTGAETDWDTVAEVRLPVRSRARRHDARHGTADETRSRRQLPAAPPGLTKLIS
jgi:hypothetical protein